jgi:hypothetical protein
MEIRIYTDAQGRAPFEQWLHALKDALSYLADWKLRGET